MHKGRITAIIGATAAAFVLAVPAAALASAHSPTAKHPLTISRRLGMTIVPTVRIIGATPGKKGYFTVLSANGREAIVPDFLRSRVESRMRQEARRPTLYDESVGDCGTSFINITTKSNGYMVYRATGFTVILPAVEYNWSYGLVGPSYPAITFNFGGLLDFDDSWADRVSSENNYPNGTWSGAVSSAASWADLDDGDICYSGGPAVSGYV